MARQCRRLVVERQRGHAAFSSLHSLAIIVAAATACCQARALIVLVSLLYSAGGEIKLEQAMQQSPRLVGHAGGRHVSQLVADVQHSLWQNSSTAGGIHAPRSVTATVAAQSRRCRGEEQAAPLQGCQG